MITSLKSVLPVLLVGIGYIVTDIAELTSERELTIVGSYIPVVNLTGVAKDTVLETGTSFFSGDTLTTDENDYALVLFMDQSTVRVQPQSQLIIRGQIDRNKNANARIDLGKGGIFLDIDRRENSEFEVMTGTTIALLKGASFGAHSSGFYWVKDGEIEVMALQTGQQVSVREGMFAQIDEIGADIITGQLSSSEMTQLSQSYGIPDGDLIERKLILRFRDADGQIIE
jgi:hypothetical protein